MTGVETIRIPKRDARSSIIRELSLKSYALGAVNLSQGLPDDGPPAEVVKLISEASKTAAGHQYSDPRGAPVLRKAIARKLKKFNEPDTEFASRLLSTAGVAAVPGRVFYPESETVQKRIRFTFSKSLTTITEAANRLTASRDLLIRN